MKTKLFTIKSMATLPMRKSEISSKIFLKMQIKIMHGKIKLSDILYLQYRKRLNNYSLWGKIHYIKSIKMFISVISLSSHPHHQSVILLF